ncbi:unnamed protein product [Pipistrellus nathusii]|uniref:Uncharacterized protein n=1 Tax=Pipistrellus nathusii TaxID=59473 RepID=A0ABP0AL31_PIPNA
MARVTRKPQAPSSYGKPNFKYQREAEEEGHLSMQILREITRKVKRPFPGISRIKASPKTPSPSVKSRRPTLFGLYHRLSKALIQNGDVPQQD